MGMRAELETNLKGSNALEISPDFHLTPPSSWGTGLRVTKLCQGSGKCHKVLGQMEKWYLEG